MTQEILGRILGRLEIILGPVIADIVARIIAREVKLDFSAEQLAQLQANRARAVEALNDERNRA